MASLSLTLISQLILIFIIITTSTAIEATASPPQATTTTTASPPPFDEIKPPPFSPFTTITPILSDLGYHDLAMAAHSLSLSSAAAIPWLGPTTIFAPADTSVRTCPSCSLSLLLQEHTVPGLYPLDYLRNLAFGTKIETILPGRCLTVTATAVNATRIYVGGAEVTRPDLFSNGHVIVHGLQGFVSHLSPYSCSIDKMTSLSLPQLPSSSSATSSSPALMRLMIADAMIRLRTSGFSILALALRVKYPDLINLQNMTIFALDDSAIFHGGHGYIHEVKFHIVPNRLMKLSDLESLPPATVLPTLLAGETLTVTTGGGGGFLSPMRINYVRIKSPDLLYNMKLVVHGLSLPFPHLRQSLAVTTGGRYQGGADRFGSSEEEVEDDPSGRQNVAAPTPRVAEPVEMDYHHGL